MQSCQFGTFSRSPQSAHTFPCSYFAGKQLERFRRVEGMPGHDPNDGTHYPTIHRVRRNYIPGYLVLVVQRTDTIQAHGEGAQQQHPLTLDARGTGNAVYYVSPKDGRIVQLNTGQDLDLAITMSGKVHRFKQSSKQDFSFVR